MAALEVKNSLLANPLATPEQLSISSSQLDGVPADLERSIIHAGQKLIQYAGILLRLPQEIITQAIVIFTRYWVGAEGGSLLDIHGAKDISAASLYLTTKGSLSPLSPRSILTVYAYLSTLPSLFLTPRNLPSAPDPSTYHLTEGDLQRRRLALFSAESKLLTTLGHHLHVALPHALALTYLQSLSVLTGFSPQGAAVAKRAFKHLNSCLFNPQSLYLTQQPSALATAAIYLAAKEVGVRLPECEWWEVFDVEREELGFLVVAMVSFKGWVEGERERWGERRVPLTREEIVVEMGRREGGVEEG
ncbi:hypothetical protein P152DRAFT_396402 [Eremomyces bilateralis CBS 781.70]|uniref:Cyclin-L2 n=1 Tax=Eremomyces bilateralis CBS 781.70 TaxID=1392243 RepID=A0A6G1G3T6_9PEZI|nr:uncharacterized protein P152DRAFT_396402 [Eremomyces bilateralis CBS 781.70]KAF1812734.1 hypothetical protein P152DRAFT_396402 [Eremomyces bilateralis CBS 781.70]